MESEALGRTPPVSRPRTNPSLNCRPKSARCASVTSGPPMLAGSPCGSFAGTDERIVSPVALLTPVERLPWIVNASGKSTVLSSSTPPATSPGRSGVALLATSTFESRFDGMRSNAKARRSGSVLGTGAPLSSVVL